MSRWKKKNNLNNCPQHLLEEPLLLPKKTKLLSRFLTIKGILTILTILTILLITTISKTKPSRQLPTWWVTSPFLPTISTNLDSTSKDTSKILLGWMKITNLLSSPRNSQKRHKSISRNINKSMQSQNKMKSNNPTSIIRKKIFRKSINKKKKW